MNRDEPNTSGAADRELTDNEIDALLGEVDAAYEALTPSQRDDMRKAMDEVEYACSVLPRFDHASAAGVFIGVDQMLTVGCDDSVRQAEAIAQEIVAAAKARAAGIVHDAETHAAAILESAKRTKRELDMIGRKILRDAHQEADLIRTNVKREHTYAEQARHEAQLLRRGAEYCEQRAEQALKEIEEQRERAARTAVRLLELTQDYAAQQHAELDDERIVASGATTHSPTFAHGDLCAPVTIVNSSQDNLVFDGAFEVFQASQAFEVFQAFEALEEVLGVARNLATPDGGSRLPHPVIADTAAKDLVTGVITPSPLAARLRESLENSNGTRFGTALVGDRAPIPLAWSPCPQRHSDQGLGRLGVPYPTVAHPAHMDARHHVWVLLYSVVSSSVDIAKPCADRCDILFSNIALLAVPGGFTGVLGSLTVPVDTVSFIDDAGLIVEASVEAVGT